VSVTSLPRLAGGSRGDSVARVLRSAITGGALSPGDRLLENDLAAQLGTSNGPIREALRQLESEGLVIKEPYRGTIVAEISQREIEEVLVPVRITIERFTFQEALPLLTDADLDALAGLVRQMREAEDDRDPDRLADADLQFHELVIQRSGHTHCLQLWRVIQPRVRAYFRRDARPDGHQGRYAIADQHDQLLAALRSRDVAQVLDAVDAHIHLHLHDGAAPSPPS
jgi:DNA-binding GntR family transcriptional regulator